jgi:NADPH:quinone reductase-like Zn-dependent oxidoreductase
MTTPEKMSGIVMNGHGGPVMLEWRDDLTVPTPGKNDVIVRVKAAGVNNTDINTRIGWYAKTDVDVDGDEAGWSDTPLTFPRIQGADVCGEIVAVGDAIDASRIGERILIEPCLWEVNGTTREIPWYFGSECDGGFAQFTRVAAVHAHKVETDLTDLELASFPCSYSTAENMLTRANVSEDETVLVTGASGGVGSAAIQLAQARGAKVIAVTSASKAQALLDLGAIKTLDRNDDFVAEIGANSVDVVIDLVAGEKWPTLLDVLRPKGRYAVSGAIGGHSVELDVRTLYLKDLSFFGCTVLEREVFGNLVKRIERKEIAPLVAETFALRDIDEAQKAFNEKGHIGKIVLKVD